MINTVQDIKRLHQGELPRYVGYDDVPGPG
jgi:hypothetical protein